MVFNSVVACIICDDCSISTDVQWLNVALNLHALVGVVLMAPLMNRKAWFCILSNVARCVSVAKGSTAVFQGRSDVAHIYSCRSVRSFAPLLMLVSLLTIFNRRLAFAAVFSMCFLIESVRSSCMPIYYGASSLCISSLHRGPT